MPLFADLIAALAAGALTYLMARWYANSSATPARPAVEVARAAGEAMRPHLRLRRLIVRHLDRTAATGFLLTLALSITLLGGLVLGVLAFLVRRVAVIQRFDNVVASWGYDHRSATSTNVLHGLTDLGSIEIVVALAIALVVFDVILSRNRWSFLFLLTVLVGMEAITLGVKDLVGRVRPTLDLHWLSDVIAGLSIGWAWFALCSVVFGGRLLKPTAGVEVAAAEAAAPRRRIRPQSRAARKQPTPTDRHRVRQGLPTGRNRQRRSGPDPPALPG